MPAVGGALGGRAHPALTWPVDLGGGSAAGATGSAVAAARGQRLLGNEVVVHFRLDVDHGLRGEELHDGLHGRGQPGGALLCGTSPVAGERVGSFPLSTDDSTLQVLIHPGHLNEFLKN